MNGRYDETTDKYLKKLMVTNPEIEKFDKYEIKFKNHSFPIWISNYPYAYGRIKIGIDYLDERASRTTIYNFHKWVEEKKLEKILNN